MDLKEFCDEGYLQEVNRQFFHPLGLALVIGVDEETDEHKLMGIWDNRDDKEGIYFEIAPDTLEKAEKVRDQVDSRYDARMEALGYWVQPFPDSE